MKRTFTIILMSFIGLMLVLGSLNVAQVEPQYLEVQTRLGQPDYAGDFAGTLHDEIAALLGITPDELVALHREGKPLNDILIELNVDVASFTTQLVQARNELINQAVSQGQLSEARAELMQTRSEAMVQAMLQREIGPNASFAFGPNTQSTQMGTSGGTPTCPNYPQHLHVGRGGRR